MHIKSFFIYHATYSVYIYIHMYIWWIHRRSDDWLDGVTEANKWGTPLPVGDIEEKIKRESK